MAQILCWGITPPSFRTPWSTVYCPDRQKVHDYLVPTSTILIGRGVAHAPGNLRYLLLTKVAFPMVAVVCFGHPESPDLPPFIQRVPEETFEAWIETRIQSQVALYDVRQAIIEAERTLNTLAVFKPLPYRPDLVCFDMDGTLVKSDEYSVDGVRDAIREVFENNGLAHPVPDRETVLARMGLNIGGLYKDILPPETQVLIDDIRQLGSQKIIQRLEAGEGKLFDGVQETLTYLREKGVKLALVSTSTPQYFRPVVKNFGLEPFFDATLCVGEHPDGTKTAVIRDMIARFGATHTVMVGDRRVDIEAGSLAGVPTVGVLYGFGGSGELDEADYRIHHLAELPHILGFEI